MKMKFAPTRLKTLLILTKNLNILNDVGLVLILNMKAEQEGRAIMPAESNIPFEGRQCGC